MDVFDLGRHGCARGNRAGKALRPRRSGRRWTGRGGRRVDAGACKAIALETSLPILAIPDDLRGLRSHADLRHDVRRREKDRQELPSPPPHRDLRRVPHADLADSAVGTARAALNAIAHAAEGLYAQDANPVMSLAEEASGSLSACVAAHRRTAGRHRGTPKPPSSTVHWLCGPCWGSVGMALHHKVCRTLGGMFDLPHAETHAVMLPYSMGFNLPAAPAAHATSRAERSIRRSAPATSLYGLPSRSFTCAGVSQSAGPAAADIPTAGRHAAVQAP